MSYEIKYSRMDQVKFVKDKITSFVQGVLDS